MAQEFAFVMASPDDDERIPGEKCDFFNSKFELFVRISICLSAISPNLVLKV
jgi:hypothetical protein